MTSHKTTGSIEAEKTEAVKTTSVFSPERIHNTQYKLIAYAFQVDVPLVIAMTKCTFARNAFASSFVLCVHEHFNGNRIKLHFEGTLDLTLPNI